MGSGGGGNFFSNPIKSIKNNPISTILNPIGSITDPLQNPLVNAGTDITKNIMSGKPAGGTAPNVNIPDPMAPNYQGDQSQIDTLTGKINSAYGNQIAGVNDTYAQQQRSEQSQLDKSTQDLISNLTTGSQGEELREKYNSLGLLDSGAFNEALANSFEPIQQQAANNILSQGQQQFGDIRNILGQQAQSNINTAGGGTQRQFSLEDWYNNALQNKNLAQSGANLTVQSGNQNAQNQLFGNLLGAGTSIATK